MRASRCRSKYVFSRVVSGADVERPWDSMVMARRGVKLDGALMLGRVAPLGWRGCMDSRWSGGFLGLLRPAKSRPGRLTPRSHLPRTNLYNRITQGAMASAFVFENQINITNTRGTTTTIVQTVLQRQCKFASWLRHFVQIATTSCIQKLSLIARIDLGDAHTRVA